MVCQPLTSARTGLDGPGRTGLRHACATSYPPVRWSSILLATSSHTDASSSLSFFYDRIVSLLGKLPILGCLVPEIVRPVHVV